MAYTYINPNRYDAESPITEGLMTDIIENIESLKNTEPDHILKTSGTFNVPSSGVTKLRVVLVGGGGGGGPGGDVGGVGETAGGGGGACGGTLEFIVSVTPSQSISYVVGAGGAGSPFAGSNPGADGTNSTWDSGTYSSGYGGGGGVAGPGQNQSAAGLAGICYGIGPNGGAGGESGSVGGQAEQPKFYFSGGVAEGGVNNGGLSGGGAGASWSYPVALSSLGSISQYKGGDGADATGTTAGGSSTYAGGGGGGASDAAPFQPEQDGGDGGDGFIMVWEIP